MILFLLYYFFRDKSIKYHMLLQIKISKNNKLYYYKNFFSLNSIDNT